MTTQNKYREFWIDTYTNKEEIADNIDEDGYYAGDALRKHPRQGPLMFQSGLVHVIEIQALKDAQAEIQKLKEEIEELNEKGETVWTSETPKEYQRRLFDSYEECSKLKEENQRYRMALEFYGNRENWRCDETYDGYFITGIIDSKDVDNEYNGGKRAREVLKGDEL